MNKRCFFLIPMLLLALFGCRQPDSEPGENALFSMVPSDALAVASFDRLDEMMTGLLDSTDVFRCIDYGTLSKSGAVLSYCYTSTLNPVLIIDVSDKEDAACDAVRRQAEAAGMEVRLFEGVMAMGPSVTVVASSERHYDESASIWDAPGFSDAASHAGDRNNVVFLRCSGAQRWLPRNIAAGVFTDRQAVSFVKTLCEWIVLEYKGDGQYSVKLSGENSPKYFSSVLESLSENRSDLMNLLPEDVEFVLSVNTEGARFRENYENYLDANVRLEQFRKASGQWQSAMSRNPLKLLEEYDIREVAIVRLEGQNICVARVGRKAEQDVNENPYPGLMPVLFGEAFKVDDSWMGRRGSWVAFGSRESVEKFVALEPSDEKAKAYSFIFRNKMSRIASDNNGIVIWNSNQ